MQTASRLLAAGMALAASGRVLAADAETPRRTASPLWDMGRNFRQAGDAVVWMDVAVVALVAIAVAAVLGILLYYFHQRERKNFRHPGRLFNELCKAHLIDRKTRRLLRQVAREQKLAQPAMMFLDPDAWQAPQRMEAQGAELARIRERVFAAS